VISTRDMLSWFEIPCRWATIENLTALGLHFGHHALFLRRPLPAALNHLAIQFKHSFWTVQKDPASLSTLLSTIAGRPVQTGRLL
jgi:hypothetical protein